jgi:hypothetical protein
MGRADVDGDGRVSLQEWQADAWRVHQEQWGVDAQGRIPTAFVIRSLCAMAHGDPGCAYGVRVYLRVLDRNRDGFVDRAESDRDAIGLFQQNDLNRDGLVTLEEMQAVAAGARRR